MIKEIEHHRSNIHALSALNMIQFIVIIFLFLMSGDITNILPKILVLIVLLMVGIGLLIRKKK